MLSSSTRFPYLLSQVGRVGREDPVELRFEDIAGKLGTCNFCNHGTSRITMYAFPGSYFSNFLKQIQLEGKIF